MGIVHYGSGGACLGDKLPRRLQQCNPLYVAIIPPQELICDNIAAVQQSNASTPPGLKSHMTTNFDAINEIMALKANVFKLKVLWVKAHNTDVNSFRANTPSHLEPCSTPTVFLSPTAQQAVYNNVSVTVTIALILLNTYAGLTL
eukprot:12175410-Ditylum_brightwellii.AAC.1